jgi:peptidoglycan/xylan/chitin deacetylase (PgdA/CDA1 family)
MTIWRATILKLAVPACLLLGAGCLRPGAGAQPARAGAGTATASLPPPRPDGPSGLPLPPSSGVPRPAGKPGNLVVLDWAGFKAAVSYTFDDANSSQIAHYPELRALGVRMTFYLITGKPEASDPVWAAAVKDGHEIGNHSKSHAHAGTGADLDEASGFIQHKIGATAWTMAAPFGDGSYRALATSRFLFNRGVQGGLVRPNDDTDPFVLPCFVPAANAPAAAFDAEVEGARRAGGWAIVLVHGFSGGTDGAYKAVRLGDFVTAVAHARARDDVWIDSLVNVGAYWRAQKLLAAATPRTTAAGDSTTWSWSLPPHFPPGKFVRVRVDGGTLTQAGKPLAWDDHGYYEVALDAGALALEP